MHTSINEYTKTNAHGMAMDANAHKLIEMLLAGAIDKLVKAKGCLIRKDIAGKGINISAAISIIGCLNSSLDFEVDGDIAKNLNSLYEYMMVTLVKANIEDDLKKLDEVSNLISEIYSAWQGIAVEAAQILKDK